MGGCCGGGNCGAATASELMMMQPPTAEIIMGRAPQRAAALIRIFLISPHYANLMIAEEMVGPGNFVFRHVAARAIGLAGGTRVRRHAVTRGALRVVGSGVTFQLLVRVVA